MQEIKNKSVTVSARKTGVGFIRSRKSEDKLMDLAADLIRQSADHGIEIIDVMVDRTGSKDVDRGAIDDLANWIEGGRIKTVVIRSIYDITSDLDDMLAFLMSAEVFGVEVLSMSENFEAASLPWDGGILC